MKYPYQTTLEIRYSEPAKQFLVLDAVVKAISDKPIDKKIVVGGSFEITLKDKSAKILIEPQRIALSIEEEKSLAEVSDFVDSILKKIFSQISFPKVLRIGCRTLWLKEYPDTFENLIKKYKDVFYKDVPLITQSSDVAIPLTLEEGGRKINFNSGPMKKEQFMALYSQMKNETSIPEKFIFVDIDFFAALSSPCNFQKKDILDFVSEAYNYATKKSSETFAILQ